MMETKHAIIIGICIIIGFAIDPLTRDTSSTPNEDWINVTNGEEVVPYNISSDWEDWKMVEGFWVIHGIQPADIESAKVLDKLHGK